MKFGFFTWCKFSQAPLVFPIYKQVFVRSDNSVPILFRYKKYDIAHAISNRSHKFGNSCHFLRCFMNKSVNFLTRHYSSLSHLWIFNDRSSDKGRVALAVWLVLSLSASSTRPISNVQTKVWLGWTFILESENDLSFTKCTKIEKQTNFSKENPHPNSTSYSRLWRIPIEFKERKIWYSNGSIFSGHLNSRYCDLRVCQIGYSNAPECFGDFKCPTRNALICERL